MEVQDASWNEAPLGMIQTLVSTGKRKVAMLVIIGTAAKKVTASTCNQATRDILVL